MDLGKELIHAINPRDVFSIHIMGLRIPVSDTVINMWITMAILVVLALVLVRNFKKIPQGKQNVVEVVVDFFNSLAKNSIGHYWKTFAPYLGTVGLFLVLGNALSLFNILPSSKELYELTHIGFFGKIPEFTIKPPTKDINITTALAVMSMIAIIVGTIRAKGFSGWMKSFIHPMPIIAPFKVLDYIIRPTSLSLRLFGNVLGAFIVMELIYLSLPAFLPAVLSIYFDLFDGILQAYVFVFLSSFYIAETVE